jgi:hypothetical protein
MKTAQSHLWLVRGLLLLLARASGASPALSNIASPCFSAKSVGWNA